MAQLLKTFEDCAFTLAWTERGLISGGVDGSIRITHAAAPGGEKSAKAAGAPTQDAIQKAHTSGVHAVAGDRDGQSAFPCRLGNRSSVDFKAPAPLPPAEIISVGINGDLAIWDAERRTTLKRVPTTPVDAWCLAHSPALAQFAAAGQGRVTLWSVDSAERLATIQTPTSWCTGVAYSPDGLRVAVCGQDGRAHVVDVEAQTVTASFDAHVLPARAVAFSSDGSQLFTSGDDARVSVWDVSGGGGGGATSASPLIASIAGHTGSVTALASSPDRPVLATGSADTTVRIWDTRRREQVHLFGAHSDRVHAVAWSPDGARVASASDVGNLGIFLVSAVL